MTRIYSFRMLPISVLLLIVLVGCGGKKNTSGSDSGPAKTPDQAVQNHLNNPNVPEAEKEQIRKHMAPAGQ